MKKLIELLNDYEKWKGEEYGRGNYVWGIDKENKNIFASRFPDGAYICEDESGAIIICKGYEFIKRLVDNDKIRKDIYRPIPFKIKIEYEDSVRYIEKLEDRILMELSIQEKPIEFLVSILK